MYDQSQKDKRNSSPLGYPYTRPRAPIGAMLASPGPIYKLPPLIGEKEHDFESIHYKAPAYSFGHRTKMHGIDRVSPGPAAYEQNPKMTTRGEVSSPSFSIKSRKYGQESSIGPGPGCYLPNYDSIRPKSPEFKFGLRPDIYNRSDTPGPNAYPASRPDITSDKPSAPKFSMGLRTAQYRTDRSPGPAEYAPGSIDVIKTTSPKYSMGVLLPRSRSADRSPGPAAYLPEVSFIKKQPPKFSFGILHSPYEGYFRENNNDEANEC